VGVKDVSEFFTLTPFGRPEILPKGKLNIMENVEVVEATGMEFLSDRWGSSMVYPANPDDIGAVERLAGFVADCNEFAFVVRDVNGVYGIRVECEFVWHASDDEEMVSFAWGDLTDEEIFSAVTNWVATINVVANDFGVLPGAVIAGGDEMFNGRIGACWFVPESNAASAVSFVSALSNVDGPQGAAFAIC
jgi:hypothetical protein